jgi:hypothetical protein
VQVMEFDKKKINRGMVVQGVTGLADAAKSVGAGSLYLSASRTFVSYSFLSSSILALAMVA